MEKTAPLLKLPEGWWLNLELYVLAVVALGRLDGCILRFSGWVENRVLKDINMRFLMDS